jgi:hypothetical protein
MHRIAIGLLFLVAFTSRAADISIATIDLNIGDSQSDVLARLSAKANVIPIIGTPTEYMVETPDKTPLGIVYFENESLKWAFRRVRTFSAKDVAEAPTTLVSELQRLSAIGKVSPTTTTRHSRDQLGTTVDQVVFTFPRRTIELTSYTYSNGKILVFIDEALSR